MKSHQFNIHLHSWPGEFLCDLDLFGSWVPKIFYLGFGLCPTGWLGFCSGLVEVSGGQSESFWADASATSSVYCHLGRTFDAMRLGGGRYGKGINGIYRWNVGSQNLHKPFRNVNVMSDEHIDWHSSYRYMIKMIDVHRPRGGERIYLNLSEWERDPCAENAGDFNPGAFFFDRSGGWAVLCFVDLRLGSSSLVAATGLSGKSTLRTLGFLSSGHGHCSLLQRGYGRHVFRGAHAFFSDQMSAKLRWLKSCCTLCWWDSYFSVPFLSFLDTSCVVELSFDHETYPMAPISQHIGLADSVNQGPRGHLKKVEEQHGKPSGECGHAPAQAV